MGITAREFYEATASEPASAEELAATWSGEAARRRRERLFGRFVMALLVLSCAAAGIFSNVGILAPAITALVLLLLAGNALFAAAGGTSRPRGILRR